MRALPAAVSWAFRVITALCRGQHPHAQKALQSFLRRACKAHSRMMWNVFLTAQSDTSVTIDRSFKVKTVSCDLRAGITLCHFDSPCLCRQHVRSPALPFHSVLFKSFAVHFSGILFSTFLTIRYRFLHSFSSTNAERTSGFCVMQFHNPFYFIHFYYTITSRGVQQNPAFQMLDSGDISALHHHLLRHHHHSSRRAEYQIPVGCKSLREMVSCSHSKPGSVIKTDQEIINRSGISGRKPTVCALAVTSALQRAPKAKPRSLRSGAAAYWGDVRFYPCPAAGDGSFHRN